MRDLAVVFLGYLLGSIPFAYVTTRLFADKDIRGEGDTNVGTRNVLHVAGLAPGLLTLCFDAGKGALACQVARRWSSTSLVVYLTAFAVILGHGFPVWLGWHGGKGLAAAFGFFSQLWPYSALGSGVVLLAARSLHVVFDAAFGVASGAFLLFSLVEGNDPGGVLFIVSLLVSTGVKKLIDLPREKAARAGDGLANGARRAEMHSQNGAA